MEGCTTIFIVHCRHMKFTMLYRYLCLRYVCVSIINYFIGNPQKLHKKVRWDKDLHTPEKSSSLLVITQMITQCKKHCWFAKTSC